MLNIQVMKGVVIQLHTDYHAESALASDASASGGPQNLTKLFALSVSDPIDDNHAQCPPILRARPATVRLVRRDKRGEHSAEAADEGRGRQT